MAMKRVRCVRCEAEVDRRQAQAEPDGAVCGRCIGARVPPRAIAAADGEGGHRLVVRVIIAMVVALAVSFVVMAYADARSPFGVLLFALAGSR